MIKIITTLFLLVGLFPGSIAQTGKLKLPEDVRINIEKRIAYEQSPSIVVGVIDKRGQVLQFWKRENEWFSS